MTDETAAKPCPCACCSAQKHRRSFDSEFCSHPCEEYLPAAKPLDAFDEQVRQFLEEWCSWSDEVSVRPRSDPRFDIAAAIRCTLSALAAAQREGAELREERCDHVQLYCDKCKVGPYWTLTGRPAECATCRAEAAEVAEAEAQRLSGKAQRKLVAAEARVVALEADRKHWAELTAEATNRRIAESQRVAVLEAALAKVPHLFGLSSKHMGREPSPNCPENCAALGGRCAVDAALAGLPGAKPTCSHPLGKRIRVWRCADCGEPMPNTEREVLGDPIMGVSFRVGKGKGE